MKYGICITAVAPVRATTDDRSEMVTQLLFGEKAEILNVQNGWLNIKAKFDGYEGWLDAKMMQSVSRDFFYESERQQYASELFNLIIDGEYPMTITLGAHLSGLNGKKINLAGRLFDYDGEILDANENELDIIEIAQLYINTPYLWGGKSNFGIDCSGFVQQVFKMKNIFIPRDAVQQAEYGEVLSFIEEAEAGDLAFFDDIEGRIIHVGIIMDNQKIIHAHGKVRIDPIDSTGIFNTDFQKYSHKLRFLKRIILKK